MSAPIDMAGQVFGRLTVVHRDYSRADRNRAYWHCQCQCGGSTSVARDSLVSGRTRSCGCIVRQGWTHSRRMAARRRMLGEPEPLRESIFPERKIIARKPRTPVHIPTLAEEQTLEQTGMNNKLAREILALCRSRFEVRFSFVTETDANITLESLHPNPDSGYTTDFTVPTKFLWQRTLAGKLRAFRESREGHTTANPRSSE